MAACQDMSTTPTAVIQDHDIAGAIGGSQPGNPPPPPIDSGAVGVAEDNTSSDPTSVVFRVTYFLNKPENSGWLKFNKDEFDNTDVDNSAAIKMQNGVFSGKGIVRIQGTGGVFIINLAKVDYAGGRTSFNECAATVGTEGLTSETGPSCFSVALAGEGVTYVPKGGTATSATLFLRPGPTTVDSCSNRLADECFISTGQ